MCIYIYICVYIYIYIYAAYKKTRCEKSWFNKYG